MAFPATLMVAKPIGHRVILSQRASIIDPRSTVPYRAIALGTTPSCWKIFLPSQKTSLFLTDSFTELSLCILLACIYSNKCSVTALYVIRFSLSIVFTDLLFCVSCFCLQFIVCQYSSKKTVVHKFFTNFLGTQ